MAGNLLRDYVASVDLTVTALHSLAASASLLAGWSSAAINNDGDDYENSILAASFVSHASNRQAGQILVYVYGTRKDTPTWPDLFSSGTEGTEGAATVHSVEVRNQMHFVDALPCNATASAVFTLRATSLKRIFGDIPNRWAVWVTQNIATSTNAGFAASGSIVTYTPKHGRYT